MSAGQRLLSPRCGPIQSAAPPPLLQSGLQNEGKAGAAVLLPAGRYKITQFIELQQSNVAVRGEGVRSAVAAALLKQDCLQVYKLCAQPAEHRGRPTAHMGAP
jgi:hypothetical protein